MSSYRFLEDTFYKWSMVISGKLQPEQVNDSITERVQVLYTKDGVDVPGPVQWKVTPYQKVPDARLFIVEVGEDPDNVFQSNPPVPMDYAVIFYQLRQLGADKVAVTSSLSWPPPPDAIATDALSYEIADYNRAVIGLVMSPSARRIVLPKALESLVLQPEQVKGSISSLTGVGRVVDPPQVQSDKAIFIAPMRVETESDTVMAVDGRKLPLFVRWGNYVLPTLPLVSALDALGLKVSDIRVSFGDKIYLGNRRILPIDESGCITVQEDMGNTVIRVPATRLVPMQDVPHDVELQKALASSQAVLLGEGKTPLDQLGGIQTVSGLWNWEQSLDVTAAGVQALLQGMAPAESVSLNRLGRWGQLIVLFDVLLLGTWALTFPAGRRRLVLFALAVGVLATGLVMASFFRIWLPMTTSLLGVLMLVLASRFIDGQRKIKNKESKASADSDDSHVELCPVPPPTLVKEKKAEESCS